MPSNLYPEALQVVGLGKETAWGTIAAPTYYFPAKNIKPEDQIAYIKDDGVRGTMAATHQVFAGPSKGQFAFDVTSVLPDAAGMLLVAMLGPDTKTGSAAPFTHTFNLASNQPASLTATWNDGFETRQFAGLRPTDLSFKWSQGAELQATVQGDSLLSAVGGSVTPTYLSGVSAFEGWQATATLAGTADADLVGFEIDLKRKNYIQHGASGAQAPTNIAALQLGVTGKATFDKTGDTELNDFLNNTQPAFVITLTNGTYVLTFQMSKCAFMKANETGKDVMQVDVDFEGVENSTDAGPCEIILENAVATAY